jgi:uncharacterized protein DUF4118
MRRDDDSMMWTTAGPLGAIALGIVLIPLRTITSASNLAFVFLAFTIVVAELGGRRAALATALISAMSLNFFLTEPYLTLAMSKPDDIVAFVALAVCGLIAAAFGRRRERWSSTAGRVEEELDTVSELADGLKSGNPLPEVLDGLRRGLGLGAIVLRDADDRILAASPGGAMAGVIPDTHLAPDTFFPSVESTLRFGTRGLRLPEGGGRLTLRTDRATLFLDLWEGAPEGLGKSESETLAIAASMLELALSHGPASHESSPSR